MNAPYILYVMARTNSLVTEQHSNALSRAFRVGKRILNYWLTRNINRVPFFIKAAERTPPSTSAQAQSSLQRWVGWRVSFYAAKLTPADRQSRNGIGMNTCAVDQREVRGSLIERQHKIGPPKQDRLSAFVL
jgi:hypothetical protein